MYASVVVLGFAGLLRRPRVLALLTAGMALVFLADIRFDLLPGEELRHLNRFALFFYIGALLQAWRPATLLHARTLAVTGGLVAAAALTSWFVPILRLAIVPLVYWFAHAPGGSIRRYNRVGDYSYGLFVYGFPIQQALVAWRPDLSPWAVFIMGLAVTLPLAILSWHILELPVLTISRKNASHIPDG